MLEPITKKITDESDGCQFSFIFHCDICGSPWHSVQYRSDNTYRITDARARENERVAAYERANREALLHFNRCPSCKRMVCDDCFRILSDRDVCKECSAVKGG